MGLKNTIVAAPLLACLAAGAECLPDEQIRLMTQHYFDKKPVVNVPLVSAQGAACARAKYNAVLTQRLGAPIGYKVGLTHPSIQRAMKGDGPAWGVLHPGTLLPNGTQLSVAFGATPTVEGDLLVRVRSADIHAARTRLKCCRRWTR